MIPQVYGPRDVAPEVSLSKTKKCPAIPLVAHRGAGEKSFTITKTFTKISKQIQTTLSESTLETKTQIKTALYLKQQTLKYLLNHGSHFLYFAN